MPIKKRYFAYILTSDHGVLFTGVTNDLWRRLEEHRSDSGGFATRYRVKRLVFWEETGGVHTAIAREKQIKAWRRSKKLELIRSTNPSFRDLDQNEIG